MISRKAYIRFYLVTDPLLVVVIATPNVLIACCPKYEVPVRLVMCQKYWAKV